MIWQVFDNMEQCSAEEVQRLLKCVSSQRAEKAMSYKRLQHQYACLKAYDILHKMLEEQGVIAKAEPLYFDLSLHGKPYISRYPDVHFNISHCKYAIAVAIDSRPIGLDVERCYMPNDDFLRYTMNDSEIKQILTAEHPDQAFALLWTAKEAYVKMKGESIHQDIPRLLQNIDNQNVIFESRVNVEKQYACSIVSQQ